jgi:predicted outer membrane repeat protein
MTDGPRPVLRCLLLALGGTLAVMAALFLRAAGPARADTVVTTCTTAGIQAALNAGGVVTFNCGGPVTIPISPTLVVTGPVTLDGGAAVTLDGQGLTRILSVTVGSALTLTHLTLVNGNAADGQGGGAVHVAMSGTLLSLNTVYTNNRALTGPLYDGGALFGGAGSTLDIRGSTFLSNTGFFGGGAVSGSGITVIISDSAFLSNTAGLGGGVFATTATISGSTFLRNTATFGGAVVATTATISGSTFLSNTATNGGAVQATTATISRSTLRGNTATFGGAVSGDTAAIDDSTVVSNTATFGGAVYAVTIAIENATITANTAPSGGGAVYFGSSLALTNATVLANGTATFSSTATTTPFTLTDSIVAGPGSPLCAYPATLQGVNVIQGTSCGTLGLINAAPQLGPLQDNGGPTWTAAPLPGSPAIGAAGFCLPSDQRGVVRSAPCDVGAYQTGAHPTLTALAPPAATVLDPGFTLTVTGTNFLPGTEVLWVGSPRATGVLSSTALTAAIPAADLTVAGSITVTARYGLAGDSTSNGLLFSVAKRSQTITFAGLPDRTVTEPPFSVTATASSGLAVTFATSGACSVAGSQVTLTGVGSCTITGQQAGDAVYLAATPVNQSFPVTKGNQTIAFAPLADRTVGDPPFLVSATASSGLAVAFSASGACSVAGTLVTLTGEGSCTITASQPGDATFGPAAPVGQTFMVRPVTVYLPGVFIERGIG